MNNSIDIFARLIRVKLTLAVALSAIIGYIFSGADEFGPAILVALGVISLSGASSVLNQVQERKEDALMARTARRPIPAGQITVDQALLVFIFLLVSGSVLLWFVSIATAIIGIGTILLYNGIYTPLKKQTSLALFPGAFVGALPPVIGWVGGGGGITDPSIVMLAGFMFLWQVPHFLLLAVKYHEQYRKAGFKVAVGSIASRQTRVLLLLWVVTTSFTALFFPFFGLVQNPVIITGIIVLNSMLIFAFFRIAFTKRAPVLKDKLHGYVSIYMVVFLLLIAADSLLFAM